MGRPTLRQALAKARHRLDSTKRELETAVAAVDVATGIEADGRELREVLILSVVIKQAVDKRREAASGRGAVGVRRDKDITVVRWRNIALYNFIESRKEG